MFTAVETAIEGGGRAVTIMVSQTGDLCSTLVRQMVI